MSKTSLKTTAEWRDINWRKLERVVYKLQKRIYRASQRGDIKAVRRLQKILMSSWSAKALAVRKVTQDNRGKKTAGVDGVKSLTPKQRLSLTGELKLGTKVKPTRRVWIPKPGKDEKRPLGIPTMKDRALQALVKLALEPEWEARFEPNSYGFRPGRSCLDAIEAIYNCIRYESKYVLDADISKCFDRINHEKLLEKLNTFPTLERQIRSWLKAGVMDNERLFPTEKGTPQGGTISPLLANIALHGMEKLIKNFAGTFDIKNQKGHQISRRDKESSLNLIRYADDFVIIHKDLSVIKQCQEKIEKWLSELDLELKPSKTRIINTLNSHEKEEPGFDFLGFNVRQYPVGKHASGKKPNGKLIGFKTLIKPSKGSIKRHYEKIAGIIEKLKPAPQEVVIRQLNPIIRGWSNYYSTQVSAATFSKLDYLVYKKLYAWARKRHRNKSVSWRAKKYWHTIGNNNWNFASKENNKINARLVRHSETPIVRHVKVKGTASPYDGHLKYWSTRMGKHPEVPTRIAILLKAQKGKCTHCGLIFREEDVMEVDHIIPKSIGGKDEYKNLQLLHRHCHDQKTARDGSRRSTHDKGQVIEEPDEVKVSCPVLKTSQ